MTTQGTSLPQQTPKTGMPPLQYWALRLLRRMTPQAAIEFMLERSIFLTPGWDTRAPQKSVELYRTGIAQHGRELEGSTVCIVGFGGGFSVALALLELGVKHVLLQDPFAPERSWRNAQVPAALREKYFQQDGDAIRPNPDYITITEEYIHDFAEKHPESCDFIFSSSVLEHVGSISDVAKGCAMLTRPGGVNVHVVDLRDHFFKYPFEMLCYSDDTWETWLNASNNLNRLREGDYQKHYEKLFSEVMVERMLQLPEQFQQIKHRIRPEFLTGDDETDCVGRIKLIAKK